MILHSDILFWGAAPLLIQQDPLVIGREFFVFGLSVSWPVWSVAEVGGWGVKLRLTLSWRNDMGYLD